MRPTYTVDLLHALDDHLREVIAEAMVNWSHETQPDGVARCTDPRTLGACWEFEDVEDWDTEWTPGPDAARIHLTHADIAEVRRQTEPLIGRLRGEADRIMRLLSPVYWDDYEMEDPSREAVLELRLAPVGVELCTDYEDGFAWNTLPAEGVTFAAEAHLVPLHDLRDAIRDAHRAA